MNVAPVRSLRASKRPLISDPALVALQRDVQMQSVNTDDLRRRWEQIVSGARA